MRVYLFLFFLLLFSFSSQVVSAAYQVLPGIDVYAKQNFGILQGKRIGLITNHTGRTVSGASTIDVLYNAPGLRLVALFSPEHGIRGESDEKLASSIDRATGVPIHSLYGSSCRPTASMLQGLDILVFDIQEIGTRFYTYIGTLSLAMQAAKEAGIPFVVLDRPNPIGGEDVQGAVPSLESPPASLSQPLLKPDNGCASLTSIHPIPTRHGMTMGELARLFNVEYGIGCDLTVIPIQGWRRNMYFDTTGLAWVNPSPNMKSLNAAILYPGLGVLEAANLSVGRGTERPFEMYGAPWVDSAAVMNNLSARTIPGISFKPCEFVPTAAGHPYRGKTCFGVCVAAIDRNRLNPVMAGLNLLQAFYEAQPKLFKAREGLAILVGDKEAWGMLTQQGKSPEETSVRWKGALERFVKMREKYLLY